MANVKYHIDHFGLITQYRWCAEEGQYITRMIGHVYDFTESEIASMGTPLDDKL